jgi:hypothetical protein
VCALPVTGSSGIPLPGAKNLETKSYCALAAVTMTPRIFSRSVISAIARRSGLTPSTVGSSGSTIIRSRNSPVT